ncbi:MAG TPA: glutamate-1-semialdehyde 2,1-aminomutase [Rhodothermales bacterium]|nr:glutamate-1-semialdehyde 2,1-aminomutase [Rhodothermales bacterium]
MSAALDHVVDTHVGAPPLDAGRYARSRAHQHRAHAVVPGGAHTYARGDDQMPEPAPVVIARGEGCRVWDVDGNPFIEYGMGLRAVSLGHAHPRVVEAARAALGLGSGFTRPHAIELEAAEAFLGLVPGAEMVKFGKHGSDATSGALRLARAVTGRAKVALCADHPFFSQHDWFIGTTPMAAGIPDSIRALSLGFPWGDAEALESLFEAHPGEIACVVMEPARGAEDPTDYLRAVRDVCDRHGALLVFDEIITGFRWHEGGAQTLFGVTPDLSCWGKAIANGFSVSALAGKRAYMERGGEGPHERVFLLSSTNGGEVHTLAAAVETMAIYREGGVTERLHEQGARLRLGATEVADALGVADYFEVMGRDCNLVFATRDPEGRPSQGYRTLLLQELVRRGVLAPSFVVSAAHDDDSIDETVDALAGALAVYRDALDGGLDRFLHGRPVQPAIRPFG